MSFCHFFIDKKDLKDYLEENRSGIGSKTTAEKVSKLGFRIENLVQSEKGKFSDFFSLKCECKIHCANLTGLLDFVMKVLDRQYVYILLQHFLFQCFKTQKKFVLMNYINLINKILFLSLILEGVGILD